MGVVVLAWLLCNSPGYVSGSYHWLRLRASQYGLFRARRHSVSRYSDAEFGDGDYGDMQPDIGLVAARTTVVDA